MASPALICDTEQWKALQVSGCSEYEGIFLDYSRQQATGETIDKLLKLAEVAKLKEKIEKMFKGGKIKSTENMSVLHVALRAPRDAVINSDGVNVVPEVWSVKDKIKEFSDTFRSGSWVGATGKPLTNVVSVGIGGNFLGPLFVHTALQTVVVVSKTFTTAETMLNARTLKEWIVSSLGPQAVAKHMIAVSTNLKGIFIPTPGDQPHSTSENDDHIKQINELRAALNAHASDDDLRHIIDSFMAHYYEAFRLKGVAAKADTIHVPSGMWKAPVERCFYVVRSILTVRDSEGLWSLLTCSC
ncbi:unnamed protein product [Miscanthus lutarioriparius]|uniref:DOG1 domain-containing protein n=1 Tax=Miscanthus lutarioriparius TaxID=422564 RepID=A0A811RUZ2_9POAL|nr:unnamed protein product [Miscanthus lutarioriparius]